MATFGQIPSNVPFNNFQVVTSSTRPSSPDEGDHIYETDTDLSYFWTGSSWAPTSGQLLAQVTLSAVQASIDFQNIPQTFASLLFVWSARSNSLNNETSVHIDINASNGSYSRQEISGVNTTVSGLHASGQSRLNAGAMGGASATADAFGFGQVSFPRYTQTTHHKNALSFCGWSDNLEIKSRQATHRWANTAAINRLTFEPSNGSLIAGTYAAIYGLR